MLQRTAISTNIKVRYVHYYCYIKGTSLVPRPFEGKEKGPGTCAPTTPRKFGVLQTTMLFRPPPMAYTHISYPRPWEDQSGKFLHTYKYFSFYLHNVGAMVHLLERHLIRLCMVILYELVFNLRVVITYTYIYCTSTNVLII